MRSEGQRPCAPPPTPGIPVRREGAFPHATRALPARCRHQPPELPTDPVGSQRARGASPQLHRPPAPHRAPGGAPVGVWARRATPRPAARRTPASQAARALRLAGHGVPVRSPSFAQTLRDMLAGEQYDIVEAEGIELVRYLPIARGAHLIFSDHNVEHQLQQRAYQVDRSLAAPLAPGGLLTDPGASPRPLRGRRLPPG